MVYEAVTILLLAVICFLLYKLYRIKYTAGRKEEFISESWKRDLMDVDEDRWKEFELRFGDIESKISGIEKRVGKNEGVVERLVEELS